MENKDIFEEALKRKECFSKDTKAFLLGTGLQLAEDEEALLGLFAFYQDEGATVWERASAAPLFFEKQGENILLRSGASEIRIMKSVFFSYLALVSDIFLAPLPLGSCVRLKEGAFSAMPDMPEGYAPEAVVTDRYIAIPEAGIYFPYTGVVYPLGAFGTQQMIHFGPQLIEDTLHGGYTDEREEAFHELMKEEYILEKGLHSMSFATGEEAETLRKIMAGGG